MTRAVRVAVVNDFELIVRGVAGMLEPFRDRVRVVELDVRNNPDYRVDIALYDTYGDPLGGIERVASLATEPRVRAAVVYAGSVPHGQLDAALAAGARGVLSKSMSSNALVEALIAIDRGEVVISPVFRDPSERAWPGHNLGFTARESEVAALLAQGLSNRGIAEALWISEHTVKTHLKALFRKARVASRTQLIARLSDDTYFRRRTG